MQEQHPDTVKAAEETVTDSGDLSTMSLSVADSLKNSFREVLEAAEEIFRTGSDGWKTFDELTQLKLINGARYLHTHGLIDQPAVQFLEELAVKYGCNDHVNVSLAREPMSSETSAILTSAVNENLGFSRYGNLLVQMESRTTHYPYWGPGEPAYDSTTVELRLAIVLDELPLAE